MDRNTIRAIVAIIPMLALAAWGRSDFEYMPGVYNNTGVAWTPASLTGLLVWYDPSDLSTMWQDSARTTPVTATGQSVCALNDKSGAGRHAVQATTLSCPTLQQDAGGRKYLACNASMMDATATSASVAQNQPFLFGGVSYTTTATVGAIYYTTINTTYSSRFEFAYGINGLGDEVDGRRLDADAFTAFTVGAADTTTRSFIGIADYTNAQTSIYKNGTLIKGPTAFHTAGNTQNATSFSVSVCGTLNNTNKITANIYQLVIGNALSAGERSSLDVFLRNKAGI